MKALRIKHYGYVLVTGFLFVSCLVVIFANLRTASADVSSISITSPSSSQKIFQGDQTIKGTAPALKKLSVFDGTKKIGETTSDAEGDWQLSWPKVKPGQHDLKAYLVDGVAYDSNFFSTSSIQGANFNSGQTETEFAAGVSSPEGVVYDAAENKSFVLNRTSHSVSVFDMSNNSPETTITYSTGEELTPNDDDSSLCHCENYAFAFDYQNQQLMILDFEKIYVINTQSNQVVRTISVDLPVEEGESNGDSPTYSLYLDKQAQYVYLYVEDGVYDDQPIQRFNISSGQKDQNFNVDGSRVVASSNGDAYYINRSGGYDQASLLYKYDSQTQLSAKINLTTVGCVNAHETNLAVSVNYAFVYVSCQGGSGAKQIAVNTTDNSLTDVTIANNSEWLTQGNLMADRLVLNSGSGNPIIKSLNTSTNQTLPDIEYPSIGDNNPSDTLRRSFVVSPNGKYSFNAINNSGLFIFKIIESQTGAEVESQVFTYPWYQDNDEIAFDAKPISFLHSYDEVSATSPVFVGENVLYISSMPANTLELYDSGTNDFESIEHGVGAPLKMYGSTVANRLFSLPSGFYAPNGLSISGNITISNLQTGAYEQTLGLAPLSYITDAVLDDQGEYLYVVGVDLPSNGQVTVYKINTQTLAVERTYDQVEETGGDFAPFLDAKLSGDYLVLYSTSATMKILNLDNGTVRNLDLEESVSLFLPSSSVATTDVGGNYLAVMTGNNLSERDNALIIDLQTLETVRSIDTEASQSGAPSSLGFTNSGELTIGYAGVFGAMFRIYNSDGSVQSESNAGPSILSLSNEYSSICYVSAINSVPTEDNYLLADTYCIATISGDAFIPYRITEVYETSTLNRIHSIEKSFGAGTDQDGYTALLASYGFTDRYLEPTVATATQTVNVVADSIEITSPAANAKLSKGERKIKGTAPPGKTVEVTVNGASIGNVTSDEYGLWEKTHNFGTTGTYDIKAAYTQPAYANAYLTRANYSLGSFSTASINLKDGLVEDDIASPSGMVPAISFLSEDGSKLYVFNLSLGEGALTLVTHSTENSDPPTSVDLDIANEGDGDGDIDLKGSPVVSQNGELIYMILEDSEGDAQFTAISASTGQVEERIDLEQECVNSFETGAAMILAENIGMAYFSCSAEMAFAVDLSNGTFASLDIPDDSSITAFQYDPDSSTLYMLAGDGSEFFVTAYNLQGGTATWTTTLGGYQTIYPHAMTLSPDKSELRVLASDASENSSVTNFSLPSISTADGAITDHTFNKAENFGQDDIPIGGAQRVLVSMDESGDGEKVYLTFYSIDAIQNGDIANASLLAEYSKADNAITTTFKGTNEDLYIRMSSGSFVKEHPETEDSDTVSVTVKGADVPNECNPATDTACKPPVGCTANCGPKPPVLCTASDCPLTDVKKKVEKITESILRDNKNAEVTPLKSVGAVQLFSANILAMIKRFAISVPLPIVNIFPYLLFLLLLGLIGYYLYQTQKQLRREDRLRDIYEKQKVLAEEKRNFLELASHYLRTPLTYIKAGSEIILRNKQNEVAATELSESVGHLSLFVESLVEEASSNDQIESIELPERKIWSPLLTKSFTLPVVGFAAALGVFYLIFGVIGGLNFGPARYVTQLLIMFIVIQLFYGMFKNHQKIIDEEEVMSKTLNSEASLDHTRSKLMKDAGEQLQTRTAHLKSVINKLESADTSKAIMQQGVDRLSELSGAFALVGKLESEVMLGSVEEVSVRTMAADIIQPMVEKFKEKKVKVEVSGFDQDIMLTTHKPLAELTLKTLLSNALGASKEGSSLVVKCLHKDGRVAFQIIDHGEGIPKDKIDRLFKPFVRVGPVTTFNREGIGLSLYLDRLIMHSLGGEVEIVSRFKHGTTATAIFNQKKTA